MRKAVLASGLFALLLQAALAWGQAAYPARPVHVIIPFPPGGTNDQVMRAVGDRFQQVTGQPFIIDNRGGGAGIIGTEAVARAEPDGYTIGYVSMTNLVVNPHLFKNLPYDPQRSFEPVIRVSASSGVFAIRPDLPVKTLKELVAWVKANPGKMTVGSNGATDPTNVIILLMNRSMGIDLQPVYYKGGAPAVKDFLGGHLPAIVNVILGLKPLGLSGKANLIAVARPTRSKLLPDVPTFAELGYPDVVMEFGAGLLAPAGTPRPVIDKLHAEMARILAMPEVVQRINALGNEVLGGTPGEYSEKIRTELERWGALVKILGWKAE
jgi:tripartite-type tricarboxylate transporter receptor subunit TctC